MSLGRTLGESMAEAAGYAMLARSMDQQAAQLGQARHSLEAMTQYAQKLQAGNQTLYRYFLERSETLNATRQELAEMTADRDRLANECQQLAQRNQELRKRLNDVGEAIDKMDERYEAQVQYMRDLKVRLAATEKALIHSSGRTVSFAHGMNYILQATGDLENDRPDISQEVLDVIDRAYEQFVESGQLTADEEAQKELDELKIKAPDFKPGLAN